MSTDALREDDGPIAIVTLNRPDKLNSVNKAMREVLQQAVYDLRDRDDLRMLLIRARGRFFTAGIDVKEPGMTVSENAQQAGTSLRRDYRRDVHLLFDEIEHVEKPVMIAVHAPCMGYGVELAGSCDFRVAAESADFSLPEVNMGWIAGSGGISRFTRICGTGWSKWISMALQKLDARTAMQAGFVQAVYPDDTFEDEVMALCQHIVAAPAAAQQAAKLAIEMAADLDRQSARHMERLVNTPLIMATNSPTSGE